LTEAIFVDRGYRTGLGTAFYDRVSELDSLSRLVNAFRVVVVYGPRNAGKSELVRYWAHSRRVSAFVVDCRMLRARRVLGDAIYAVAGAEKVRAELVKLLAEEASRLLSGSAGIADLILALIQALRGRIERYVILVDEFHELPRYTPESREEALRDLASLAAMLLKSEKMRGVRLIVVASEGFATTHHARSMLQGYSAA
jgi:AAA+ ATPase superfamily predicted ATPase